MLVDVEAEIVYSIQIRFDQELAFRCIRRASQGMRSLAGVFVVSGGKTVAFESMQIQGLFAVRYV